MKLLRELLRETLPEIANGSFSIILQKLTRITESDDIEAILILILKILNEGSSDNLVAQEIIPDALTRAATRAENELNLVVLLIYHTLLISGSDETNIEQSPFTQRPAVIECTRSREKSVAVRSRLEFEIEVIVLHRAASCITTFTL
ncbi:uncharacterized protein Bfra_008375 [Botrytis fragariae]|uniref:Uncharacterized protein n=1 Tax=Botrytis fragariae TaxID=1964551 RepID=A0A8H6ASQ3_9HELO|nr:uncharacterized protein Bfra_008375 [Botrytis fragariae]KAF5873098.1 hypothetical protein Bfra_008375 [Botrytis fragariae]